MEKKFYEIPVMEIVEMKTEGFFCGSTSTDGGWTTPTPEDE